MRAPAPAQLVARAHDFRVNGLNRVNISRPDDAKGQLARSNPVLIRFNVSTAFQKLRDASTFTEPAPPPGDKLRVGMHDTGRLRRAAASVPFDQFLESALGRSWLRLDQLRSIEDDRISDAYVLNVGPVKPPTHRQCTAATATAAIAMPPPPCAAKANRRATVRPADAVMRPRQRRGARRPISVVRLRRQR